MRWWHCFAQDDLEVAPDFFSYFSALRQVLEEDHSLWCVSAWNDNGKPENVDQQSNGEFVPHPEALLHNN